MTRRVLVTGSRTWTDTATIRKALPAQWGDGTAVLVTGACPRGADALAEQCWRAWGGRVERHPADWAQHGRAAGYRRNAQMVATGAEVCLTFLDGPSRGTRHTAGLAADAGIPVRRYSHPEPKDTDMATDPTDHDDLALDSTDPTDTGAAPRAASSSPVLSLEAMWERWRDWNRRDVTENAARSVEAAGNPAAAAVLRGAHTGTGPTALDALAAQHELAARLAGWEWITVRAAREQGATWSQIAATTDSDPCEARSRYVQAVSTQEVFGGFATSAEGARAWGAAGRWVDELHPDTPPEAVEEIERAVAAVDGEIDDPRLAELRDRWWNPDHQPAGAPATSAAPTHNDERHLDVSPAPRTRTDEQLPAVTLPSEMVDGIEQRRTSPAQPDDPAELQARLDDLRAQAAAGAGTPASGWQTVGAEQAAHQLADCGTDLGTARAMVADYLRETAERAGFAAEWGLDQGDLDAIAADHHLPTTLPPATAVAVLAVDEHLADQDAADASHRSADDATTVDAVDEAGWSR